MFSKKSVYYICRRRAFRPEVKHPAVDPNSITNL